MSGLAVVSVVVAIAALLMVLYLVIDIDSDTISGDGADATVDAGDDTTTTGPTAAERERLAAAAAERVRLAAEAAAAHCRGEWSACTALCEVAADRYWTYEDGIGDPSCQPDPPTAPDCAVNIDGCTSQAAVDLSRTASILCHKPSTVPTGYVFNSLRNTTANADLPLLVSEGKVHCDTNYSGPITINECQSGGEWVPTGCTQDECIRPTNTTGYDLSGVAETNLGKGSFDVTGITCASNYAGTASVSECVAAGQEYTLTGCQTQECVDRSPQCDSNATCDNSTTPPTCTCNPGYSGDGETCTEFSCTKPTTAVGYDLSSVTDTSTVISGLPALEANVSCDTDYHIDGGISISPCSAEGGPWTITGCARDVCTEPATDASGMTIGQQAGYNIGGATTGSLNKGTDFNVTGVTCSDGSPATATTCLSQGTDYQLSGCTECVGTLQPLNCANHDSSGGTCDQRYIKSPHIAGEYIQCQTRANDASICDQWEPAVPNQWGNTQANEEAAKAAGTRDQCQKPSAPICDHNVSYSCSSNAVSTPCSGSPNLNGTGANAGDDICTCAPGYTKLFDRGNSATGPAQSFICIDETQKPGECPPAAYPAHYLNQARDSSGNPGMCSDVPHRARDVQHNGEYEWEIIARAASRPGDGASTDQNIWCASPTRPGLCGSCWGYTVAGGYRSYYYENGVEKKVAEACMEPPGNGTGCIASTTDVIGAGAATTGKCTLPADDEHPFYP